MNEEHKEQHKRLKIKVHSSVKKLDRAKSEHHNILGQMTYLGTLGVVFILPVIVGAYLGVWLDNKLHGFSISWTVSLIFLGVIVGIINVYLIIRE
ncbi:MAG: AtpZ/AtpI family protein [Gammaproteobacteria bacterium]|nr:AtpZ/AtpI family protein [Gammaproteobacteria bacterium]